MKKAILSILVVGSAVAYAQHQSCLVPAPSTPPKATEVVITDFPADGGHIGCKIQGITPGGKAPTKQAVSNAKCLQAKLMGDQAVAVDNGWNDGGTP